MNNIRFISSFVIGSEEERVVKDILLPSLIQWKLAYQIFPVKSNDVSVSYMQRCPVALRTAMDMFRQDNFVWLDSDSKISQNPELFFHIPFCCDIGVHYLDLADHYGRTSELNKVELIDGTLYCQNSEKMRALCDEWIVKSRSIHTNHARVLASIIDERVKDDLNVFILPRDYCYLESRKDGSRPAVQMSNPVISHCTVSK